MSAHHGAPCHNGVRTALSDVVFPTGPLEDRYDVALMTDVLKYFNTYKRVILVSYLRISLVFSSISPRRALAASMSEKLIAMV